MDRWFTYVLLLLLAFSCERPAVESAGFRGELVASIDTKGTGSGNVYRVYLNGLENYETAGVEVSGTYADLSGGFLVPCSINEDMTYKAEDPECGLRAMNGAYKMHIVYPAETMELIPAELTGEEDSGIKGYLIPRTLGQGENEIYLSKAMDVKLNGVYLYDTESRYVFDADAMPLKQPRSRVSVSFKCGDKITETTLRKVSFKNIVQQGYFRPVDGIYYFLNDGSDSDDVVDMTLFEPDGGEVITQQEKILDDTYILSMDYRETNPNGSPRWPLPSMVFETGSEENPVVFTVSLGWNFEQQKEYVFNITMNSMYVNMEVSVNDWDSVETGTSVDNAEKWTVEFPLGGDNEFAWTQVSGIVGTI